MTAGVRALTLLVLSAVFIGGGLTGFRLLTSGTEAAEPVATCTPSVVQAGAELDSNLITVNVFNASNRSGLANRVTINLQANGFLGGQIGNSTSATKPQRVAILTDDPEDPRVKLVATQFRGKMEYAAPDISVDEGIIVIVGDDYRGLKSKSRTSIESDRNIPVCVPTAPVL